MKKKIKCIMLVDDDVNDNFFHEREIKKINPDCCVVVKHTGREALDYLISSKDQNGNPDAIFLDINMPGMNGWDFLKEYRWLDIAIQDRATIIMLTTSENPDDETRARAYGLISDYVIKPLTRIKMNDIIAKYFG